MSELSLRAGVAWLSGAQIGTKVLQLAAYASITRRLGEAGFGRFIYAFSLLDIVAFLATLGLPVLYTRHVAAGRNDAAAAAVLVKHRLTTVIGLLGLFWLAIVPPDLPRDLLVMMFLAMLLRGYSQFGASGLRGKSRMDAEAIASIAGRATFAVGAGVGVWLVDEPGAMLRLTFIAFLLGEMVTTVLTGRGMEKLGLSWSPKRPSASVRQDLWIEMLPFAAAGLLGVIAFRVDLVMIRELSPELMGDHLAGAYGAAYRILEAGLFLPAAVGAALFPALVRARNGGELAPQLLRRSAAVLLALGLAGAAVLWFGAPLLVRLFAGEGYAEAVPALATLGMAVPFLFVNFALGSAVFAVGKEWWGFAGLIASVLLNIFGNLWVLTHHPEQALVGAALFTAAAEAVLTVSHTAILTIVARREA